ncbi:MAG: hypothetical protein C5S40_03490 [ANME-2 cluster archaeon]|nr:hypothetical protein [ANME-2 cluster archaeon]
MFIPGVQSYCYFLQLPVIDCLADFTVVDPAVLAVGLFPDDMAHDLAGVADHFPDHDVLELAITHIFWVPVCDGCGGPPECIGEPDLGWHVGSIYPSLYEQLFQFSSVDPDIP